MKIICGYLVEPKLMGRLLSFMPLLEKKLREQDSIVIADMAKEATEQLELLKPRVIDETEVK